MNMRNTLQRSLVLEAVNTLQCHATADQVYAKIAQEYPDISKGTVYRNLNLLSELGKIRKLEIPGGADRYDHIPGEHYHARCTKCSCVLDVDMECIPDLENKIRDARGFQFTGHDVIFKGVCPDCNSKDLQ